MATDRLKIYNGALLICGERSLASLTENREPRRLLDEVWQDGGVKYCLEQGQWKFAMCASMFEADTSYTASFGYTNRFQKPDDWVDTCGVCQDEFFKVPLLSYADEQGAWFANLNPIYVRYQSNGADYGMNLAAWPFSFTEYVKAHFAEKIIRKLPGGKDKIADVVRAEKEARLVAKNRDAMADPTKRAAQGSWTRSRQGWGRGGPMGDGGNSGSLIG